MVTGGDVSSSHLINLHSALHCPGNEALMSGCIRMGVSELFAW